MKIKSIFPAVALLVINSLVAGERPVENLTKSLEVESMTETDGIVRLTLRNVSDKAIETLMVGIGGMRQVQDVNTMTGGLRPGASILLKVADPREKYPSGQLPPANARDLRVLAVVFDDKTSDGDIQEIRNIFDDRAGRTEQYGRLLKLIDDSERQFPGDPRSVLSALIVGVSHLPDSAFAEGPAHTRQGAAGVRGQMEERLKRLKSEADQRPGDYLQSRLAALREECKRHVGAL